MGAYGVVCEALSTVQDVVPLRFSLNQNFPNPFNYITTLRYNLPSDVLVTLSIYDMLSREVTQLRTSSSDYKYF